MTEQRQHNFDIINESKLLNSSVVQMRLNAMSKKIKYETDTNGTNLSLF